MPMVIESAEEMLIAAAPEATRFTAAELIEFGKTLQEAVEKGLDPESDVRFLVSHVSRFVKEISVKGKVTPPEPKPAKKAAAKKTPAKKVGEPSTAQ